MFIRLPPDQIPRMWENIKFAISRTGDISEKDRPLYLNRLLHALLSDRAWCIVRMSEDRELLGMGILRLMASDITGENTIFIESVYSFAHIPMNLWKEVLEITTKYAKKENCSKITAYSSNPKIFEIAKELGFNERYRYFEMEI
jgi:hypothetical protein